MTPFDDPSPLRRGRSARSLCQLATAAGLQLRPSDLERALGPTLHEDPDAHLEQLLNCAEDHGLRMRRSRRTVEDAARALVSGEPLLTYVREDGRERWILLLDRGRGGVDVVVNELGPEDGHGTAPDDPPVSPDAEPTRVPLTDLARHLGLDPQAELTWLAADAALPHAGASSSGEPLPPLRRMLRMLRPDRGDLLAVIAFSVAIGVLLLGTPVAVQALVNFVAYGSAIPPVLVVAFLLFLGLAFAAGLTALETWVVEILQRRLFVRTLADLAGRLPRVRAEAHDGHHGPELVNRFLDVLTLQKTLSQLLLSGVGLLLSVLVGLVVLAFYHPLLLAFDIVLLVVISLLVLAPARRGTRTAIVESDAKYRVQAWLEELARNPTAFRSGGARRWVHERSDELARDWVTSRATHFRVVLGQTVGALGLQVLASTVLLGLGGLLVIRGDLTLGQLVAAELIVTAVVGSVAKTGKYLESYYDMMAATHKVGKLLDLPVERAGGERLPAADGGSAPLLAVHRLRWSPPGGERLLDGIECTVERGRSLALLGGSGSGKSSLLELLWGVRAPGTGRVELRGVDLRDLSLESLRSSVALVGRLEVLEASVRENVRLGRPAVEDAEVREALRRVGLWERVLRLPEGLDTELRPDGRPLSSGDLRRLALARGLVSEPEVLLVDGLLDGLDEPARDALLGVLLDPEAPWTLVLATTRPELAERCTQVLELPSGELHASRANLMGNEA